MSVERILKLFLTFSVAIFFLLINVNIIALLPSTYSKQVENLKIDEITNEDKILISDKLFKIINFGSSGNLVLRNGKYAFSERELAHLKDVAGIFKIIRIICIVSFIITVLIIVNLVKKGVKFASCFIYGSLLTLAFGIIIAFTFDSSFILFHILSFDNDLWLLPQTALLINIFPQNFFFHSFITVIFLSVSELLIIYFVASNCFKERK